MAIIVVSNRVPMVDVSSCDRRECSTWPHPHSRVSRTRSRGSEVVGGQTEYREPWHPWRAPLVPRPHLWREEKEATVDIFTGDRDAMQSNFEFLLGVQQFSWATFQSRCIALCT